VREDLEAEVQLYGLAQDVGGDAPRREPARLASLRPQPHLGGRCSDISVVYKSGIKPSSKSHDTNPKQPQPSPTKYRNLTISN